MAPLHYDFVSVGGESADSALANGSAAPSPCRRLLHGARRALRWEVPSVVCGFVVADRARAAAAASPVKSSADCAGRLPSPLVGRDVSDVIAAAREVLH
jgi:hypothetical protein